MDWPTRFGVVVGYCLSFTTMYLLYDHRPVGPGVVPLWMLAVTPVVGWLSMETAGRLRRLRWPAGVLALGGMGFTGVWWWWLYSLYASHHVRTADRFGIPTLLAVAYLVAALVSGRLLARRRGSRDRFPAVDEFELSSH
jgi:hypothetical protein